MLRGFDVSVAERAVKLLCPIHQQQLRDVASAGSLRLRLSGLKSPALLIRKDSLPQSIIQPSLCQLVDLYVQQRYSLADVSQAIGSL